MRHHKQGIFVCLSVIIFSILVTTKSVSANDLVCGIATGFPPYQFQEQGRVTGFDADVLRLVVSRTKMNLNFLPEKWDDVINFLRFGKIDCITGMEINELRRRVFDFTTVYYHRHDVVFVRTDNKSIQILDDLYGKKITGDRHSFVETYWKKKGIKHKMRIMQTENKQQAMQLLYDKDTVAAIMPKLVGLYLATQLNFNVKILEHPDPGSPVAIAVKKGNTELLQILDTALQELIQEGEIEKLYQHWCQNE